MGKSYATCTFWSLARVLVATNAIKPIQIRMMKLTNYDFYSFDAGRISSRDAVAIWWRIGSRYSDEFPGGAPVDFAALTVLVLKHPVKSFTTRLPRFGPGAMLQFQLPRRCPGSCHVSGHRSHRLLLSIGADCSRRIRVQVGVRENILLLCSVCVTSKLHLFLRSAVATPKSIIPESFMKTFFRRRLVILWATLVGLISLNHGHS